MAGWFVTVNDITNWTETNKRQAEETLPLLVKKLILASCKPKFIKFPSGDSIAVGGWDGMLEVSEGNSFIPSGKSGWEFGTNKDVKGKADEDYAKRLKNPEPFDLEKTTFVFVTSRLWTKRDTWVCSKKSADKKWNNVKGINAQTLVDWLEVCPAVHRWFSELLGKRFATIWDLEQSWQEYTNKTEIKINADFLLHGRENELKSISNLISGNAAKHTIKSISKLEAYGFILAALLKDENARARSLIIKSQESWNFMAAYNQPLILIPYDFMPSGIGAAVSKGHTVIIPVDKKDTCSESILLDRQPRLIREEAFKKLGFDDFEVNELYQDTKGYFEPLLRHTSLKPIDYIAPVWPDKSNPAVLFAALFASAWNEKNNHDKEAMEKLSGLSYSEFQTHIISLSKEEDPPIRLVSDIWQIISKMDFWLLIASRIAKPYLESLEKTVQVVLADIDPSYDLAPNERYMASIKGAVPNYSGLLKKGLADSLALLAVHGDDFSEHLGGEKPSSLVSSIIYELFKKNQNIKFWYSLSSCMRFLAEAAPDEFIIAVESASSGEKPILLGLFEAEGDAVFGGCYHADLLWALELISWNKQYLAKVSSCLARLAEIDPGGNWSNRPFSSLVDIYIGWVNNTAATHDERIQIIKNILIPQYPKIAWRLMIALLFNNTHSTSGICKPEYRDWSVNIDRSTTNKAYFTYVQTMVDMLLQELDKNTENRISDLVDNFRSYNQDQQNTVIERMLALDANTINDDTRTQILDKLRSTLTSHREFSKAEWAWPCSLLDRLEEVYKHLDFNDVIKANLYIFDDHWPKFIDPIDRTKIPSDERNNLLLQRRIASIEAVYDKSGIDGIEKLLLNCKLPSLVGNVAFYSSLSEIVQTVAMEWLDKDSKHRTFSKEFFHALAYDNYIKAKTLVKETDDFLLTRKARLLLCLPLNPDTLKLVDNLPDEGKKLFWAELEDCFVQDNEYELLPRIACMLLENQRPLAALCSLDQLIHMEKHTELIDSRLLADILIRIATDPSDIERRVSTQNIHYYILKAIELLQDRGDIPEKDIRHIEWNYLKIFRNEKLSPRYLMKNIVKEPGFFVQLVVWRYKRNDGKDEPVEYLTKDVINQRAESAYELLDIISILPGQEGNRIDKNILNNWIDLARKELENAGRQGIGDDRIGQYLSRCPVGEDCIWPHESVRSVIERVNSREIDKAIIHGRLNAREATFRHPYAGGEQERDLARKYHADAETIQLIHPRTSGILREIAKIYERYADREDREVELRY